MGFWIMGTAHLGEARCICGTNPAGCPLHQHVEVVATPDPINEYIVDLVRRSVILRVLLPAMV